MMQNNTKAEIYLAQMLGENQAELPVPQTKIETYLYRLAQDMSECMNELKNSNEQNVEWIDNVPSSFDIGKCRELIKSINIPPGASDISLSGLAACINLEKVSIPDTVTVINPGAFHKCTALKEIEIPPSVVKICPGAFDTCNKLKKIKFNEGLKTIENGAFNGCSVETLNLPSSITELPEHVFDGCTALTNIYVPWEENAISNAPWGAVNATIHYNAGGEEP